MATQAPRLLVIDSGGPLPVGLTDLIDTDRCDVTTIHDVDQARNDGLLERIDAVVVANDATQPASTEQRSALTELLEHLDQNHISTLLLGDVPWKVDAGRVGLCRTAPTDATAEELWGRLSTLLSIRPWVDRVESELNHLQQLGTRLSSHFTDLDHEMRLASRLQRDFLPREMPVVGPVRFATLFRPASWVSGDIYDVFRIDEHRVGFYIADAVGHGSAASLLTMLVKYALLNQRTADDPEAVACPATNLKAINQALASQNLPNCQFVTACYCVLDTETLTLRFARGGHPHPIHVRRNGELRELETGGGLLGIFPDQEYPTATVQLAPGDKVILFSDGIEGALVESRDPQNGTALYEQHFRDMAGLGADEMVRTLDESIDHVAGSLNPEDDVTVVVAEIET